MQCNPTTGCDRMAPPYLVLDEARTTLQGSIVAQGRNPLKANDFDTKGPGYAADACLSGGMHQKHVALTGNAYRWGIIKGVSGERERRRSLPSGPTMGLFGNGIFFICGQGEV